LFGYWVGLSVDKLRSDVFLRFYLGIARPFVLRHFGFVVPHASNDVVRRFEAWVADDDNRNFIFGLQIVDPVALFVEKIIGDFDRNLRDDLGRALLACFLTNESQHGKCERFRAANDTVAVTARTDILRGLFERRS
jgi:hypothetical protein